MAYVPLCLMLASLPFAAQSAVAARPAPPPPALATTVQLMTVVDHPDVLGGMRVRIPNVAVKRVAGPRLVVVGDPRILGIDRSYQPYYRFDRLLVLLPSPATLAPGQLITLVGDVRTVASARATGLPIDPQIEDKKARGRMRWPLNAVVIVADSVESVDGVPLR